MNDVICEICGNDMYCDGLHSDGDGDMYDRWECLICDHVERVNEAWFADDGTRFRTEHSMWEYEAGQSDDE